MSSLLQKITVSMAIMLVCCGGCALPDRVDTGLQFLKIVGADDERYFIDTAGNRFFPWGLNYTQPKNASLIDDNLQDEVTWRFIEEDFAEMKQYSANTVRIHLQYNRFMVSPVEPDHKAFEALDRLVKIAESNELYLIITGLGAYRKSDAPTWYRELETTARWATQALFWRTLAGRVGHSPAVFAYDLMNEPVVSVCPEQSALCDWQVGQPMGGFHFVQNISTQPKQPYIETKKAWMKVLTRAIRSRDRRTLITVGELDQVPLAIFEEGVDFSSKHIYPTGAGISEAAQRVRAAGLQHPLVLGEIYNLYCSTDDLEAFLSTIEGNYRGLFGHYFGNTQEELAGQTKLTSRLQYQFMEFFIENNPNRNGSR